eukprot:6175043-Pleurochrysis_carterae.AAC.2
MQPAKEHYKPVSASQNLTCSLQEKHDRAAARPFKPSEEDNPIALGQAAHRLLRDFFRCSRTSLRAPGQSHQSISALAFEGRSKSHWHALPSRFPAPACATAVSAA